MNNNQTLLTTQAAGDWLHDAIPGESPDHWRHVLINNRRQDRRPPHRIPFGTMGRAAVYTIDALQAFADFEKSRRLGELKLTGRAAEALQAFGIGSGTGGTTGRKLQLTAINSQIDEATGAPFVQIIMNDPLRVYRLEVEEAKQVARQLIDAINECNEAAR